MKNHPHSALALERIVMPTCGVSAKEPIAIVGIGCRFPGEANSPEAFWELLKKGADAITDVPEERWKLDQYYDPDVRKAGKIKTRKGGFLKNIDQFDADFFSLFPKEAERIDPQQRLLLEITYEALEDAGIRLEDFSGSPTCVFMGVFTTDYWDMQSSTLQKDHISPHVAMGASSTSVANRLSYVYNLKGPSVSLNTACSSSLVAVHLACQSIWNGESSLGLAGGVNLILRPETSILMSKGNFLSPDGYCKTFDSRANGYVRSEGGGVILLKPLSKALADGDHIYSLIRATAVNQDGFTEDGFTVPSPEAQTRMLETVYRQAGVNPAEVSYVEAHGTGTPVGDPLETRAFGNVVGKGRGAADPRCVIGSVKTNIGHLEAAAGIAGLIKLALITKNRQIPANLHFLTPNPGIPFDDYKLRVPVSLETIPAAVPVVYAGVNSFGAGGTNAHCVLQEYIPRPAPHAGAAGEPAPAGTQLFTLSAKTEKALKDLAQRYVVYLHAGEQSLADICLSLATRRSAFAHRLSVVARTKEEVAEKLLAFAKGETRQWVSYQVVKAPTQPKIGFVYSGQGPQWFAMGRQLLETSPVFREVVLRIDKLFSRLADWSLLEEMSRPEAASRIGDTRIAQPAIMAVQIGLTEVWKSWGVQPAGYVGHSIGEVAAAYAAGALTLPQAVEVIYHRSRNQNQATGKGKMLAVGLDLPSVKKEIAGLEAKIAIAAINGPQTITLAGDVPELEGLAANLEKRDIFHRFLQVNVPFHSHHMEPLKDEMIAALAHLEPARAVAPLYSTVTGNPEDGLHLTAAYWYANVRETVYFTDAVQSMLDDGFDAFVEIGPHPVLATGIADLLKGRNLSGMVVPSLRRKEDEEGTMMHSLGLLAQQGYAADWHRLLPVAQYVKLPRYPWQHQRYWFETRAHRQARLGDRIHPFLTGQVASVTGEGRQSWHVNLNPETFPYLHDHKVDGAIVFPGTGHLEIAIAAGKAAFPGRPVCLEDIHFEQAFFLPEDGEQPDIRLEILNAEGDYFLCSRPAGGDSAAWTRHSRGRINALDAPAPGAAPAVKPLLEKLKHKISIPDFYVELKEAGLNYGEAFRRVQKLWVQDGEILAAVSLSPQTAYGVEQYHVHPALLDACLHTIFAARTHSEQSRRGIYLPVHIGRYAVYAKPGGHLWTYVRVTEAGADYLKGDYQLLDEDGNLVAAIEGLACKYIQGSRGEGEDNLYNGMYQYAWQPLTQDDETNVDLSGLAAEECYLVFADRQGVAAQLTAQMQHDDLAFVQVVPGESFRQLHDGRYEVNPAEAADLDAVFASLQERGLKVKKMIYLWALDNRLPQPASVAGFEAGQAALTRATMHLLQGIDRRSLKAGLVFVTQATELVGESDATVNYPQAALLGMARVFMNEYPYVPVKIIDISEEFSPEEARVLYSECSGLKFRFTELALRGAHTYFRRLEPVVEAVAAAESAQLAPARGFPFEAVAARPGDPQSIAFHRVPLPPVGEEEIRIEVCAAGVNPGDGHAAMGGECAGIVRQAGARVREFKPGDPVIAWTGHAFAGYVVATPGQAVAKPDGLSYAQAAGLPVAYTTAWYALHDVARIRRGDAVLVHAARWDVAVAAVQVARYLGARIIATAATPAQRNYLAERGAAHVLDVHADWAGETIKLTAGRGVAAVLHALTGTGVHKSLACLAPFGACIELNPEGHTDTATLDRKRLGNTLSFHTVDFAQLLAHKPDRVQQIVAEVARLFAAGDFTPAAADVYPVQDLALALERVQDPERVAAIAIAPDDRPLRVLAPRALVLPAHATYLITGGASGFGLEIARWLAGKGARHLALVSRSGPKSDADRRTIEALEADGVQVRLLQADITDYPAVRELVAGVRATLPPLRGIVHSAAMLDDQSIPDMTAEVFMKVYRPKVYGAWNFHEHTKDLPLDFFLMFSSISAVFGFPGQANYSSANNFLDKLALHRQSLGLAGSAVNLGVLDDYAGMSKEGGRLIRALINQGWGLLGLKEVTDKLENVLLQKPAARMVANLDWKRFRDFYYNLKEDPRFAHLMHESAGKGAGTNGTASLPDALQALPEGQQPALLEQKLAESLANILGVAPEQIDTRIPVTRIGLDSLMLNQLRNWIQQKLEINFPLMKIAKGPSIVELSAQLLLELNSLAGQAAEAVSADTSGIADEEDIQVYDRWLVRNRRVADREVEYRIFCIHPVGAGASMFSHFIFNPPKDAEVLAFQLPGRENRIDEPHYEDMAQLVADMARVMRPLLDKPFIVFGHSFGGMVGFELIRYVGQHFGRKPLQLFISGTIAPQLTRKWKERDVISETAILTNSEERLLSLMSYIDDVAFLKKILPVMRKDMALIMNYVYTPGEKLDFPITAFAADKDNVVYPHEVEQWKEQTGSTFSLQVLTGDHWFLSRNKERVLQSLSEATQQVSPA